jgi:hypothetical protein
MSMTLRHTATLALVGWYLMIPNAMRIGPFRGVDPKVPISEWNRQEQFDSKEHCEIARAEYVKYPPMPMRELDVEPVAVCVSADDPRLKGK